eukprot:3241721-Pyramimonas_sp.AAC.1
MGLRVEVHKRHHDVSGDASQKATARLVFSDCEDPYFAKRGTAASPPSRRAGGLAMQRAAQGRWPYRRHSR